MSDAVRRRVAILLLLAGGAVGALAITDTGPFEDPPTAEERVQATVEQFFAAAEAGRSREFCSLLTKDARERLSVNTAQQLQIDELPECEQILDATSEVFEGSSIAVRFVSVSGNQARVEARYRLAGQGAQPRTILLVAEDGVWKINDPG